MSVNGSPRKLDLDVARELGTLTEAVKALTEANKQLHKDVRSLAGEVDAAKNSITTIKERLFAIGALVAAGAFLGGGYAHKEWSGVAMAAVKESRYERPDAERPQPVDMAAYRPHGRWRGLAGVGNGERDKP